VALRECARAGVERHATRSRLSPGQSARRLVTADSTDTGDGIGRAGDDLVGPAGHVGYRALQGDGHGEGTARRGVAIVSCVTSSYGNGRGARHRAEYNGAGPYEESAGATR